MTTIRISLSLLCLLALFDMPYSYYQFFRVIALCSFVFLAFKEKDQEFWPFFWIVSAILIQPFYKFYIIREIWMILDIVWASILIYPIFLSANKTQIKNSIKKSSTHLRRKETKKKNTPKPIKKINKNKEITLYHDNGQLQTKATLDSNGKPHGNCKEWYSNGKIFKDQNFKNGVPHGSFKTYFKNGNIWQDYNFKNGEQHGVNNEYYENGGKNIISNFKDGTLHGLKEQYYVSGNLETRTTYENGMIEGVHLYLDEDGEVIEEKIMQKGLDITMELMQLMMENDAEHMVNAGLIKDGRQEFKPGELSQVIYDYCKKNKLKVESSQVSVLNKMLAEGKIDKDFYDLSMSALGQNDIDGDELIKKMSDKK